MHAPPNVTLLRAIQEGFLRLTAISLSFQPGPDVIPATIEAWFDALRDRDLTDDDAPRVQIAFRHLASTRDTWPAPANLIDALPEKPRPYFHKLPAPELTPEEEQADKDRRRAIVEREQERLKALLHGQRP